MRGELPRGTVTFLFTDVEGSTRLLHELGAEGYAEALAEHREVIREACTSHGGVEVDTQGDAFFFAFPTAPGAIAAASDMTERLASGPIHVRIGVHTGTPLVTDAGYVGDDVHFAARVAATGHGGQIVLSHATAGVVTGAVTTLGSHRLKDIAEPVSIYQLGDRSSPPLKTIANTNLPTPASSFLGREEELYEADVLLQKTRLLTITGPGGQGKTRFALELARRAREERFRDYEDGVFACFLASLRDPVLVLPTLAQTLSVREEPGKSALETLASQLQGKKMLVLLDNLEHLLACASQLSELLSASQGLTLLVTSRELLRVQGEVAYELPPLVPDAGVALFCERARMEPAETIRALCGRLEGLPLAIELAAARMRILSPEQLLGRLAQRLDLLKGTRDADPRQQTLRATIEWSYDLLAPDEQRLFARLSVFAGCTLEAAEEVCQAELDTLESLVDKSLLRYTDGRFWMLETIRGYAGERLQNLDHVARVRDSHAQHYATLARDAGAELKGAKQATRMRELEIELDNLRAALDRLHETRQHELELELAVHLGSFWGLRSYIVEARGLLERALAGTERVSRTRAAALRMLGHLWADDDYERAQEHAQQALAAARELRDGVLEIDALKTLATVERVDGRMENARGLYEQALARAEEIGDRSIALDAIWRWQFFTH